MKKMTKKFFAVAVVIAMLMQLLVVTALADGENGEEPKYEPGVVYSLTQEERDNLPQNVDGKTWVELSRFIDKGAGVICGKEEHTHSEACYTQKICDIPKHEEHSEYGGDCYTQKICTIEEHTHSAYGGKCYAQKTCNIPEHKEHVDTCYIMQYDRTKQPICKMQEHQHSLWCGLWCLYGYEHEHIETCYPQVQKLICKLSIHTHKDASENDCQGWVLNCNKAHTHSSANTEDCKGYVFTCSDTKLHTHSSATAQDCQGYVLTCKEEVHKHTDDCYTLYYNMKLVGNTEADNGNKLKSVTIKVVCGDNKPAAFVSTSILLTDLTAGNASAPTLKLEADTNSLGIAVYEISSTYNHVAEITVAGEEKTVHPANILGNLTTGSGRWHDSYTFTVDHHFVEKTNSATCTEPGVKISVCDYCAEVQREDSKELGHVEETIPGVVATCTTTGLTEGTKCSRCNAVLEEQETIGALGHSWDNGDVTLAPTCTVAGVRTFTCTVCHATNTEAILATGHSYDNGTETTPATCTENGVMTFACQNCDDSYTSEIPATGHTVVGDAANDPSCTEEGNTAGTHCSVCNANLSGNEVLEANGHRFNDGIVTTEASCVDNGVRTYTCSVCQYSYTETIPAAGHTASDWQVIDEPSPLAVDSCTEDKEIKYQKVCTVCGVQLETKTETLKAPGHVSEEIPAVAATCEETGMTVGTQCEVCGEILNAPKEVAALGHVWGDGTVTLEPTTEATGVMTFTCQNDETHTKTEIIPMLVPTPEEPEEEPENNNSSNPADEESSKPAEDNNSSESAEEESSTPVVTPPVVQPQQPEQEVQGAVVDKPENSQTAPVVVAPQENTSTETKDGRPDTGDRNQSVFYMMLMMIAAVGMVVVQKTTKQKKYSR